MENNDIREIENKPRIDEKSPLFDGLRLSSFFILYILGYLIIVCYTLFVNSGNNLTIDIFMEKAFIPAIMAALLEEFIFRYLIQRALIKKYGKGILEKELLMILIASAIFGLSHLINIFYGEPVLYVLLQSVSATASGFFFGVLYYKTNRISYGVVFHFIFDFLLLLGSVNEGTAGNAVSLSSTIYSLLGTLIIVTGTFAMIYSKTGKKIFVNDKKSIILYICSCALILLYFIMPILA